MKHPSSNPKETFLSPEIRAEDIILGAAGIGEEGKLLTLEEGEKGYTGEVQFHDGEILRFVSEDELSDLEIWAISILRDNKDTKKRRS